MEVEAQKLCSERPGARGFSKGYGMTRDDTTAVDIRIELVSEECLILTFFNYLRRNTA